MRQAEKRGGAGLCLLSLLGGQLLIVYLLQGQLTQSLLVRPEYIYMKVLPGLIWPLALVWLFSAWQARRQAGPNGQVIATALPLGFSYPLAILLLSGMMVPIYRQATSQMTVETAGNLTWSAAVALTLLIGLFQVLLAPFAHRLTQKLSLPLCWSIGAAVALSSLSGLLSWIVQHPLLLLAGLVPLAACLLIGLPRPFGLSVAWLVFGTGLAAQLVSGTDFDVPDFQSTLLPNWQLSWIDEGLRYLWLQPEFLTVVIPVVIASLMCDLILLRETQIDVQAVSPRATLLGLGCINVLGACLGSGLPLVVLPGYMGYRRWGGGQFYCQAAGLLLVLFSLLGGFGRFFSWLPLPSLGVVIVALLLTSAASSLNNIRQPNGVLLATCWLPFLAQFRAGSPILIAMVWGGIVVCLESRALSSGAMVALGGCLFSASGILHRNLWDPDFDVLAGTYLLLALLLRLGNFIPEVAAPATESAVVSEIQPDSIESCGTLLCDNPGDRQSAEDAISES